MRPWFLVLIHSGAKRYDSMFLVSNSILPTAQTINYRLFPDFWRIARLLTLAVCIEKILFKVMNLYLMLSLILANIPGGLA
jgi:hypothetical protein